MKKRVLALITAALFCSVAVGRCEQTLSQREAELLAEFRHRPDGETLLQLALVRERQEKWKEAQATWALAKKLWGGRKMPVHSSAPTATWGRAADFFGHRLQRKINLHAPSSQPAQSQLAQSQLAQSQPARSQLARREHIAAAAMIFGDEAPADQLDLAVQADLDGDGIDELFYIGSSGPLGQRTRRTMGIAKWDGKIYRVVWRTGEAIPPMVHVVDEDGDGWKEIFCGYEPDTDNAATLYFNGQTAMFL